MQQKIDVMIVGAQKAGTTSLLRYLGEHPECISHPQKEFSFFTDDDEFSEGLDVAFKKYFAHPKNTAVKYIAKNASMFTKEAGLQRLLKHNPDCRLICILRNPVERIYSSYLMERNFGSVRFDFEELPGLIKSYRERNARWDYDFFVDYSLYAKHLRHLYKYFPPSQVTVLLFDDLQKIPEKVCQDIFRTLGADPGFIPEVKIRHNATLRTRSSTYARLVRRLLHNENFLKRSLKKIIPGHKVWKYGELLREVNKTNEPHQPMNESTRKYFVDLFKPHNDELSALIGKDLSHWNK